MVESSVFHPSSTWGAATIILKDLLTLSCPTILILSLKQPSLLYWNKQESAGMHKWPFGNGESPVSCYYYTERCIDIIMSNHFDLIIKTAFFTILEQARKRWNAQMTIRQWSSKASLIVHVSYVMDTISSSIFRLTFGGNGKRYDLSCVGAGLEDVEWSHKLTSHGNPCNNFHSLQGCRVDAMQKNGSPQNSYVQPKCGKI